MAWLQGLAVEAGQGCGIRTFAPSLVDLALDIGDATAGSFYLLRGGAGEINERNQDSLLYV